MANLKMQRGCQYWSGRYKVNGKEKTVALGIKIEGRRPATLRGTGDLAFERSRIKAQLAMEQFLEELKTRKTKERLAKEVYKIQSGGEELPEYALTDLFDLWCNMRKRSESRTTSVKPQIAKFVSFMKKKFSDVRYTYQVTATHANAFMDAEEERGLAPATYNGLLKLLKSCFRETGSRVFDKIQLMPGGQIHRVPYTLEELEQIRIAAETDEFVRPVIIIAMCTGMRLGDCCNLKWSDIDYEEGIVRVKTGKTGAAVVIPIFDWLKEELDSQEGLPSSDYVIPRQRWKYMADASYLTKQLRKILTKIGFGEPASNYRLKKSDVDKQAVTAKVQEYLATLPETKKIKRMGNVFAAYMNGQTVDQISEEFSVSKSTASLYLNEIEDNTGTSFIRGKSRESANENENRKPVQVERQQGLVRASIRDFHAFRTTWVTLALKAGVPVETVRLVTGHKTVEIVTENYFNPSQRDIRDALKAAMPFSDSKKEVA